MKTDPQAGILIFRDISSFLFEGEAGDVPRAGDSMRVNDIACRLIIYMEKEEGIDEVQVK